MPAPESAIKWTLELSLRLIIRKTKCWRRWPSIRRPFCHLTSLCPVLFWYIFHTRRQWQEKSGTCLAKWSEERENCNSEHNLFSFVVFSPAIAFAIGRKRKQSTFSHQQISHWCNLPVTWVLGPLYTHSDSYFRTLFVLNYIQQIDFRRGEWQKERKKKRTRGEKMPWSSCLYGVCLFNSLLAQPQRMKRESERLCKNASSGHKMLAMAMVDGKIEHTTASLVDGWWIKNEKDGCRWKDIKWIISLLSLTLSLSLYFLDPLDLLIHSWWPLHFDRGKGQAEMLCIIWLVLTWVSLPPPLIDASFNVGSRRDNEVKSRTYHRVHSFRVSLIQPLAGKCTRGERESRMNKLLLQPLTTRSDYWMTRLLSFSTD